MKQINNLLININQIKEEKNVISKEKEELNKFKFYK